MPFSLYAAWQSINITEKHTIKMISKLIIANFSCLLFIEATRTQQRAHTLSVQPGETYIHLHFGIPAQIRT